MVPKPDRDREAARRFLQLQDPDVTVEEIDAVLAWIDASPANRRAFERVESCWHLQATPPVPAPASRRPSVLARLAQVAVLAAIAIGIGTGSPWVPSPLRHATGVGETREIVLPDGSLATLGGASAIAVEYGPRERRVVLTDGEALFSVEKQPSRPFVVEAAGGSARALGTVFNVRRGTEGVTVSVAEGLVQVQVDGGAGVRLPVGTEVTYSAAAGLGTARSVNPERVGGWARGVLTFIDRPLVAVVADLNRYSPRLITIEDEGVRHIRVTGSVTVGGIAEWLRALENVSAVEFDDTGDAMVLRGSRRSASRRSGA